MNQHSVTIVISVDSTEGGLSRCIDSLKSQTYPLVTIICSSKTRPEELDESIEFVESDSTEQTLVKIKDRIETDYFMMVSSGDWFPSNMISQFIECMVKSEAQCVASSYYVLTSRNVILRKPSLESLSAGKTTAIAEMYSADLLEMLVSGEAAPIKAAVIDRILYYHSDGVDTDRTFVQKVTKFISDGCNAAWRLRLIPAQKRYYEKLKTFKGRYAGKRCFIIGNGPSLKMSDLDRLQGEYTFAMNKIFVAFKDTVWRPTFYVMQDAKVIDEQLENIHAVDSEYKFFRSDYISKIGTQDPRVNYYKTETRLYNGEPAQFSEDISECMYEGGTVAFICMQLAIYMGFTEIYLLGMDFTYTVAKTRDGIKFSEGTDYFSTEYIKDGNIFNYARLDYTEAAYQTAIEVSKKRNVAIYNATRGGKLELFPRVDFDSLFND